MSKETERAKAREDYLCWDDYLMGIAFLSAMRSKDPSTQNGACVVNAKNQVVGTGYNGFPRGIPNDALPWDREAENSVDTKYPYIAHAEENAIHNTKQEDLSGCRMYATLFPCNKCAIAIIQSGITEVVYLSDKYADSDITIASKKMLKLAGVQIRQLKLELPCIELPMQEFQDRPGQISAAYRGSSL